VTFVGQAGPFLTSCLCPCLCMCLIARHRYYAGRLATFDENFEEADRCLSFAYERCDPGCPANMRRVLRYLIPVSRAVRAALPHTRESSCACCATSYP
jgi:hypothetical protein